MKDLYKLAGLARFEADEETIRAAAQACKNPTDKRVIERILCDPQRKSEYDQALRTADVLAEAEQQAKNDTAHSGKGSKTGEGLLPNGKSGRLLIVYGFIFAVLFAVSFLNTLKEKDAVLDEAQSVEPVMPSGESDDDMVEIITDPVTRHNYYVTAETLNVRRGPGVQHRVVDQLQRYDELQLELPAVEEGWARVVTQGSVRGYVSLNFVTPGSGERAYRAHCMESVSRPPTGSIVFTPGRGNQAFRIEAPPAHDVSARLVGNGGETVLMGYVRAGERVSLEGVPAGRYQLRFGLGNRFSTGCGLFTDAMTEEVYPTLLVFPPSLSRSLDVEYQITIRFSPLR